MNNISTSKSKLAVKNKSEILDTDCYGITITYDPSNKNAASISSNMKEPETPENVSFNAAIDGIESLILSHFCAGLDITAPSYLEGVETAYEAISNNTDNPQDPETVTIQKLRRVDAIADETIHYRISRSDWENAVKKYDSEEIALYELQKELKVTRVFYEADVDEVNAEFELEILVI